MSRMSSDSYCIQAYKRIACTLLLILLCAPTTHAQNESVQTIQLPDTLELSRLLDLYASENALTLEYDPQAVRGEVTFRSAEPISRAAFNDLTERLLRTRGFVIIAAADSKSASISKIADARRLLPGPLASAPQSPGLSGAHTTWVVQASHVPASTLVQSIQPLITPGIGTAEAIPGTALVLIFDSTQRLQALEGWLDYLDSPQSEIIPELYTPRARTPAALSELAKTVQAAREAAGGPRLNGTLVESSAELYIVASRNALEQWRELLNTLDTASPVRTQTYQASVYPAREIVLLLEKTVLDPAIDPRRRVVINELTDALIVTGTDEDHAAVSQMLAELTGLPEASRRPTRQYVLQNRSVAEVLPILENLLALPFELEPSPQSSSSTSLADSVPLTQGTQNQPMQTQSSIRHGHVPTIVADRANNALIILATPAEHARLGALIERLDIRQPQVMLELVLVSLSQDQSMDLGIEIDRLIDGPDDTRGRISSLFGLGANAANQAIGLGGAGLTGVVLSPGEFSIVVRALEAINDGRSLSSPRVLVENNSPATIDAVVEAPFVSTNASNTVATTSFGGTQEAGTQVTVTPHIAQGGHVRLEYAVSLSSFVGESADPSLPPPRQQTSVQSTATIPDGYTIAVGGIEVTTQGDAEARVPGIGSVPLLGELFKNRSRSNTRSRFYVFIRAEVLRSPSFADLKFLSDLDAIQADIDDQWPHVEPRLIR